MMGHLTTHGNQLPGYVLHSILPITSVINAEVKEPKTASMPAERSSNQSEVNVAFANEVALSMLYEQFRRPIHTYVYRLLGNQEDADDTTQEVFIRAFTSWDGLHERDRLSAWLYRIATNLCVDQLRRRKRISWWPLSRRFRQNEQEDEPASEDLLAFLADNGGIPEIAERDLIRAALAALPVEYATVLVMHAAQGVPYQEIAEIISISPNAAATRISRAKKMFAEQYLRLNKDGAGKREQ